MKFQTQKIISVIISGMLLGLFLALYIQMIIILPIEMNDFLFITVGFLLLIFIIYNLVKIILSEEKELKSTYNTLNVIETELRSINSIDLSNETIQTQLREINIIIEGYLN